jgi:hypothetical protein
MSNGHYDTNGNGLTTSASEPQKLIIVSQPIQEKGISGRKFVIGGIIVILLVWGVIFLAFQAWRANYEALAEYGATQIAPLVDSLTTKNPPGVEPKEWKQAIDDTHGMLLALTGSGLLERKTMEDLRNALSAIVEKATPDTVRKDLTDFWNSLERKAGPVISPVVTPVRPGSRYEKRNPRPARPAILKDV